MPIYTIGQNLIFQMNLKVVKVFVYNQDVYYIVILLKKDTPLKHLTEILWGCLRDDGEHAFVPPEAMIKAQEIVKSLDISNLE
jgi:hypothetical protein